MGVDQGGRRGGKKLGEAEGGETLIRIYHMRKESAFNKRGRNDQFLLSTWSHGCGTRAVSQEPTFKTPHSRANVLLACLKIK